MTPTTPTPPSASSSSVTPTPQLSSSESATTANPYARPGFDPSAPNTSRLFSILSFAGGIASLIFGQTVILPLAAIIIGHIARRREPDGRTFSTWGLVLSYLSLFGWLAVIIIGIVIAAPIFLFAWF
jgi:hypothetical protein